MKPIRLGRPPKYDWETLMESGDEYTFTQGKDFDCMPVSFGVLVRMTARRYGREVAVSVQGDDVVFQFGRKVA
jgi:hypothetical protein